MSRRQKVLAVKHLARASTKVRIDEHTEILSGAPVEAKQKKGNKHKLQLLKVNSAEAACHEDGAEKGALSAADESRLLVAANEHLVPLLAALFLPRHNNRTVAVPMPVHTNEVLQHAAARRQPSTTTRPTSTAREMTQR